jgi:hypothetical protein
MKETGIVLAILFGLGALASAAENLLFDARVRAIEAEMNLGS